MGQRQSSPAERFEQLRENINARRLRPDGRVELSSNEWENSDDLHRGDEIARRIPNSPFWHHGIYLGDGLVCDLLVDKRLARVPMEEFLDNQSSFHVMIYDNDSPEARADTAEIAMLAITEPCWKDAEYNLLENNCEHFAKFCRTGKKYSKQADTFFSIVGAAAVSSVGSSVFLSAGAAEA